MLRFEIMSTGFRVGDLVIASPKTLISSLMDEGGVGCIDDFISIGVSFAVCIGYPMSMLWSISKQESRSR